MLVLSPLRERWLGALTAPGLAAPRVRGKPDCVPSNLKARIAAVSSRASGVGYSPMLARFLLYHPGDGFEFPLSEDSICSCTSSILSASTSLVVIALIVGNEFADVRFSTY